MSKNKLTKRILLALSASMLSLMPLASALPSQGAYDNSAAAAISTAGNTMSITGKNANNILNWFTFSVGKGETVRFTDNNNYLNLVNGVDISRIYGTISGGNNVYLVNPYGILFGQGAMLDNVGSFVASTRDISDINKQAFLNDSSNVNGVLYTDYGESRNKDYFPDDSPYVPTISVAEINLTNVPASATKIVLDGPSGVVLKNTELLDKVTQVSTRVNGGEVGIGSSNANVNLTDAQKSKISLFLGGSRFNFDLNPSVIKSYKLVTNVSGLQAMTNGNYLLGNNIDASSISSFRPIEYSGIFDGLGYDVSNLKVNRTYSSDGSAGLFSTAYGTIRNLNLKEVNIAGGYSNGGLKAYIPPNYTTDAVGAVAAHFTGSMSNVHVTSTVEENDGEGVVDRYGGVHITRYGAVRGYDRVGGLIGWLGYDDSNSSGSKKSEIRNSSNGATVVLNGVNNAGGIVGTGQGYLFRVYNTGNINIGSTYADRYKTYYPEGIGGIAGSFGNNKGDRILSAYNTGRVFGGRFAAGIVGLPFAQIGDTYNLGEIVVNEYAYDAVGDIVGAVGAAKGNDWSYNIPTDLAYTSKETGNKMSSYYIYGKLMTFGDKPLPGNEFGNASSEDNVKDLLNKNWYGIGYPSTSDGDDGGNGDNSGGDSGTNTGGNGGDNGDPTSGGTGESTSGGSNSSGSTDEIEKAKAILASQKYSDIMAEIKKENEVVIPYDEKRIKPVLPTLKEESKKTERIFHVDPGYNQEGYNTDGGGLFVYNLNIDNDPNSETPITFDLYNTQNATGYIEYYDKDGKYITAERIDPFSPVIKSAKTFIERYEAVKESIQKNGLFGETDVTDKINSRGKTITAPPDTYKIVVTNNPATSRYAQASNFVDSLFETVDMVRTMKDAYEAFTALKGGAVELPVNQILENVRKEMIDKIAKEAMVTKEVVKGATKEAAKEAGLEFVLTLGQEGMQELLTNSLADTFKKHGGEIAFGAGKEAAKTMVGEMLKTNPGVLGLKLMEDIGKGMDGLSQKITEKKLENVRPMVFQLNY